MRKTVAAVLLCATCSTAIAADAPLPAGKAAGTKQAALAGPGFIVLIGLAGVATFAAIMASSQDHNNGVTTPTTISTVGTGV